MDCEKKIMELSARTDLENLQSIIYQTRYQEVIQQQMEGILAALQSDSYSTVSDYLSRCYQDGYIGVMYDLHGQDIPLIMPIDQKAVVRAIQTDSKISKGLYNRLGEDVGKLKTSIRAEVSRGIAAGFTWNEVATKLAKSFKTTEFSKAYNNAMRIVRTEGHRIQVQSAMDAQQVAKNHGADIVKQWDSTLDDRTRETHRMLDGQIRELDEPFEVGGMQADAPGMFGIAAQDCNCRCALLQRARWALDEDELNTLKERAEFFGLDKTKDFEEFKEKYLRSVEKNSETDIMNSSNGKEEIQVHTVGKINRDIYKCITEDIITDEVIVTDERIQHIKERHPNDYERFYSYLPEIIANPDYIIKANKPDTATVLKEIIDNGEKFQLVLRLVTSKDKPGFKNSIITFLKINERTWNKYLRNKEILYKRD